MKVKDPVSGFSHLVGFIAAIVGLVFLIIKTYDDPSKLTTMIIYGSTLILLYGASSIYHLLRTSPTVTVLLRKFDHASIFLLIAGCYTPVFYHGLTGAWRITMLAIVWALCVAGIVLKAAYINVPRMLSAGLYVMMGWLAIVPFFQLIQALPVRAILLLIGGGLFYTAGAIIYATKKLDFFPKVFGFHEVFHFFVLAGSIVHYVLIIRYIA